MAFAKISGEEMLLEAVISNQASIDSIKLILRDASIAKEYFGSIIGIQTAIFGGILTVVVAAGGLITFGRISNRIRQMNADFSKKVTEFRKEVSAEIEALKILEIRLRSTSANTNSLIAEVKADKGDHLNAFLFLLMAALDNKKFYEMSNNPPAMKVIAANAVGWLSRAREELQHIKPAHRSEFMATQKEAIGYINELMRWGVDEILDVISALRSEFHRVREMLERGDRR